MIFAVFAMVNMIVLILNPDAIPYKNKNNKCDKVFMMKKKMLIQRKNNSSFFINPS